MLLGYAIESTRGGATSVSSVLREPGTVPAQEIVVPDMPDMQHQPDMQDMNLVDRFVAVRDRTELLASQLAPEDQVVQSMPDASPAKWHRAHVTWFFETFVLKPHVADYIEFDPAYVFLFNSYYEAVGPRHQRSERGLITRPNVAEVGDYRRHVDSAMRELLSGDVSAELTEMVTLGLHHEQQHQELLLMDIKHLFWQNPTMPVYAELAESAAAAAEQAAAGAPDKIRFDGGLVDIGHDGLGFSFDNELPRHQALVQPFSLANRLVTCGDWLEFMADGGYETAAHWLSDGRHTVLANGWNAPDYWFFDDGDWHIFTLHGARPIDPAEPVSHISYYEADAFAAWAGARLPTEFEWEHAASTCSMEERNTHAPHHPVAAAASGVPAKRTSGAADHALHQMFGEVWQWTASPYSPYPGFSAAPGAVGEYNGKFMVNTWVLRGGSCATPTGHVRATYRNFFHPATRWHFSGVRLAWNGDAS